MGHVLTKSGFFVFSQCPRGLSSQAFANNRALGRERFAEQDSIDAGDKPHKRFPSRLYRTGRSPARRTPLAARALALLVGQEAVMPRGGSRSICRQGADRWRGGLRNDGRADFGALMTKRVGRKPVCGLRPLASQQGQSAHQPARANEADWRISSPTGRGGARCCSLQRILNGSPGATECRRAAIVRACACDQTCGAASCATRDS